MAIRWGPELVLIYNDAYRPILRNKHPEALGRSLGEVWWEIYPELGPLNESVLRGEREAFFAEDHPWTVRRQGALAALPKRRKAHSVLREPPKAACAAASRAIGTR